MSNQNNVPLDIKEDIASAVSKVFETLNEQKVPLELCSSVMLNALYNFQAQMIQERVNSGKIMPDVAIKMELNNCKIFFTEIEQRFNTALLKYMSTAPNLH